MSTEIGRRAEVAAAMYLQRQGFTILEQNWRTRWCEIDIIAQKSNTVHFVEVKYRSTSRQGSGLDYITNQKLGQMHFAAEFWLSRHQSEALDYRLSAIEVTGAAFEVSAWCDDV